MKVKAVLCSESLLFNTCINYCLYKTAPEISTVCVCFQVITSLIIVYNIVEDFKSRLFPHRQCSFSTSTQTNKMFSELHLKAQPCAHIVSLPQRRAIPHRKEGSQLVMRWR